MNDEESDPQSRRLCSECVGESFLKAEIEAHGENAVCSYCGTDGQTFSIEELADRVETAFEHHFRLSANEPSGFELAIMKEDGRGFERDGDRVTDVIGDTAEIDEEPAEDIRAVLEDRHWDMEMAQMGEEGPFDADAHYVQVSPKDVELNAEWLDFERQIKMEARFFNRSAQAVLSSIFEGLADHQTWDGKEIIVQAGAGTKLTGLYRARVFQSDEKLQAALEHPDKEIGSPPHRAAAAGRMNARGVSVFYGASAPDVALGEVRPPVGSRVVIGRFDFIRPVKLLDVEALGSVSVSGSFFDPTYIRRLERAEFLKRLSYRITMPVMPDDEPFDYLVTQAIADYLAVDATPPLDGIIYRSVQGRKNGFNVVLFHKSALVEPIDLPSGTKVNAHLYESTEDGPEIDYTVWENVPPKPQDDGFPKLGHRIFPHWSPDGDYREATLKLDLGSLSVHHVQAVSFKTEPYSVHRHRVEPRPQKY